jgi:hypothetical protein
MIRLPQDLCCSRNCRLLQLSPGVFNGYFLSTFWMILILHTYDYWRFHTHTTHTRTQQTHNTNNTHNIHAQNTTHKQHTEHTHTKHNTHKTHILYALLWIIKSLRLVYFPSCSLTSPTSEFACGLRPRSFCFHVVTSLIYKRWIWKCNFVNIFLLSELAIPNLFLGWRLCLLKSVEAKLKWLDCTYFFRRPLNTGFPKLKYR